MVVQVVVAEVQVRLVDVVHTEMVVIVVVVVEVAVVAEDFIVVAVIMGMLIIGIVNIMMKKLT